MTSFLTDANASSYSSSSLSLDGVSAMDVDSALDLSASNPPIPDQSKTQSIDQSLASNGDLTMSSPSMSLADPNSQSSNQAAAQTAGRDDWARGEESTGTLQFKVIWNDGSAEHMKCLVHLKNIFSAQLPKMPREYIVRLVLDRAHRSLCIVKRKPDGELKVVGGICFRPFHEQGFAEIVFCAITATEQVKGYGTRLMNHLKDHVRKEQIQYFLTYADNYAIGYFKKQGFSKQISMTRDRWFGYIKDYDGGTLMECHIYHNVDYLDLSSMLAAQRQAVHDAIKQISCSHIIHPGLDRWRTNPAAPELPIMEIPGIKQTGLTESSLEVTAAKLLPGAAPSDLSGKLNIVLKYIRAQKDAWPFQEPVDPNLVPDYYNHITQPMDMKQMQSKLDSHQYTSKELFVIDFKLMMSNCRSYNAPDTSYYKCADRLEAQFDKQMKATFKETK